MTQKGVGLLRWQRFVEKKWNNLYDQIVFRHLEVERTDQLIMDLEAFIKAW
jgi:hypothetical protein